MEFSNIETLENLTPHDIVVMDAKKNELMRIAPSGNARVSVASEIVGNIDINGIKIPILKQKFGEVTGLPPMKAGTMFIVSGMVKSAVAQNIENMRDDLVSPSDLVRDEEGRIIGLLSLAI